MKRTILTLCVFIALSSVADAARYYKCVDSSGNLIVTDNPPPDAKCEFLGAERDKTPGEREMERQQIESERAIRAGQKANEQRREAELRQRQQINRAQEEAQEQQDRQQAQQSQQQRKTQSEIQDVRNREADKLEHAASWLKSGRIKAEMLTNAARIRLGLEPILHTPERTVNTPPPVDNSPKWGTVHDPKTGRNIDGWIYK